jgi:hypothetical protein
MPVTTRTDQQLGIRIHTLSGPVDPGEVSAVLAETLQDPDFDPAMPALWDVREAKGSLSAGQVRQLAQSVGGLWRQQSPPRIAILTGTGLQYGLARMYEQYLDLTRRIELQVFRDEEEEALAWLTSSPPPKRQ